MAASSAPRLTSAASKLPVSGGVIGSIEERQAATPNPTAPTKQRAATAPNALRRVMRAHQRRAGRPSAIPTWVQPIVGAKVPGTRQPQSFWPREFAAWQGYRCAMEYV